MLSLVHTALRSACPKKDSAVALLCASHKTDYHHTVLERNIANTQVVLCQLLTKLPANIPSTSTHVSSGETKQTLLLEASLKQGVYNTVTAKQLIPDGDYLLPVKEPGLCVKRSLAHSVLKLSAC